MPREEGNPVTIRKTKGLIIAIDGPVASGKSTAAKGLAKRLGYRYIDTGATYRALAWKALSLGLDLQDGPALARLAKTLAITFEGPPDALRVLVDGQDVTEAIRAPEIDLASSVVSAHGEVREPMVSLQRSLAQEGGVVMDGRDVGTVVFPDADLKFYLDASPETRATRRFQEVSRKGRETTLDEVAEEVRMRDTRDVGRAVSPLQKAPDAVTIDSTDLDVEQVIHRMWVAIWERFPGTGR